MNYWHRYAAHYIAKTGDLSMEEDGAFSRLLDWYYLNERPVPDDRRYRVARAQTPSERKAVDTVLAAYFVREGETWRNDRADSEIAEAQPRIASSRINGRAGGRPRKNPTPPETKPNGLPDGLPDGLPGGNPDGKAPHTPVLEATALPITVQGDSNAREPEADPDPPKGTDAGRACKLMREAGCPTTNPSHPKLLAALAEGVTPEALADCVRAATTKGNPFAYAIATARSQRAEGVTSPTPGAKRHEATRGLSAVDRVKANIRAARIARGESPDD